mmetsp:Transcript_34246/g.75990  ORF Transcript_34246/g.75990 Transcript_34246/m.75990 type:complete len:236 (-) Transcript_34246:1485-2192(-)
MQSMHQLQTMISPQSSAPITRCSTAKPHQSWLNSVATLAAATSAMMADVVEVVAEGGRLAMKPHSPPDSSSSQHSASSASPPPHAASSTPYMYTASTGPAALTLCRALSMAWAGAPNACMAACTPRTASASDGGCPPLPPGLSCSGRAAWARVRCAGTIWLVRGCCSSGGTNSTAGGVVEIAWGAMAASMPPAPSAAPAEAVAAAWSEVPLTACPDDAPGAAAAADPVSPLVVWP